MSYLDQLLRIHWLRPETALWRTFDCLLMEKYGDISGSAVDLGCGDGTMSFVMAGGEVGDYDVFLDVGELHRYNDGADIFNKKTSVSIRSDHSRLRHTFEWGVDHKDGLIDKAKRFAPFYRNNLVFDLNRKLPFGGEHFDTAFSNVLYWLDDMNEILSEWHRVIKQNGRLHLFVPNANFKEKTWLYYLAPHSGERKYLNYLDRGYSALIHHCYSYSRWQEIFQSNGFAIREHQFYLTNPVIDLWNIGTRPISPLLINMVGKLAPVDRESVKEEWIDYFKRFLAPIVEGEFERLVPEGEAAFHFFVLEKQ